MQCRHFGPLLSPLGLVVIAAVAGISCIPTGSQPQSVTEESIEVDDAPPEVLLELVHKSAGEASELAESLAAKRGSADDLNGLRTHIFRGLKAADKVLASAADGSAQRQEAEKAKLDLLRIATVRRLIPEAQLRQFVEALVDGDPESELAAEATAAWLRYEWIHSSKPPAEVVPVLAEFAQNHPGRAAGLHLLADYGKKLEADRDTARAMQCYRFAMALYGEHSDAKVIEGRLAELEETEKKASAALAAKERMAADRLAGIRRQFGGFSDGYFVIYSEENVKPPRHGGIYFYRYEYDVLAGLPAAAAYVEALPEKWSWKLVQRFPQTPDGRKQAYDLWKTLLRGKGKKV